MTWRASPLPINWPSLRLAVLQRDGYRCQIRGPRCASKATDVDHAGDRDDHSMTALRAACGPCHRARTGMQGRQARGFRRREEEAHPGVPPPPAPRTVPAPRHERPRPGLDAPARHGPHQIGAPTWDSAAQSPSARLNAPVTAPKTTIQTTPRRQDASQRPVRGRTGTHRPLAGIDRSAIRARRAISSRRTGLKRTSWPSC
jgi:5-methylcytosine-specific restriction enzyme A